MELYKLKPGLWYAVIQTTFLAMVIFGGWNPPVWVAVLPTLLVLGIILWTVGYLNTKTMSSEYQKECPCCGYFTLNEQYSYDICPVCFWEDEYLFNENDESDANDGVSLAQGRKNYKKFGAMDKKHVIHVRAARPYEQKR